ncbi:hypothetical protein PI124_g22809 [Phytophthora idaei]|nr:hypothetical protein PI125_g24723 [Phytophthora idaei]KAG3125444.1 hypothetical protein PI126_g22759 [Phytophthora idaei]KAG3232103.1 hypothetical protein PI124_g22809 [Phytophthora idaei]
MIKLFLSLHDVHEACATPAQCIVAPSKIATRKHDKELPEFDYSLCIRGLFAPNSDADNIAETRGRWPFLSVELIKQLQVIGTSAWWDSNAQVECDLDSLETHESAAFRTPLLRVLPKETAMEVASKTLNLYSPL